MPNEFNRRALLRSSALAGAGALTSPLWSGASPASAAARAGRGRAGQQTRADLAADRIVASVRRPRFPGRFFPVTQFGAVGDGATDCTQAFAAAIAACHQAGTVGGPLLLIQGNYDAQTGDFPPDITGITLADWTVDTCAGICSLTGVSAADPVGTVTLDALTITASTAANSARTYPTWSWTT